MMQLKPLARIVLMSLILFSVIQLNAESVFVALNLPPADQTNNTVDITINISGYVTVPTSFGDLLVSVDNSDSDTATVSGYVSAGLIIDFDDQTKTATVQSLGFSGGNVAMSDTDFTFNYGLLGNVYLENANIAGYPGTFPPGVGGVLGTTFELIDHYAVINQGISEIYGTGLASGLFDQTLDFNAEPSAPVTFDTQGSVQVSYDHSDGNLDYYMIEMVIPVDIDDTILTQSDPVEGYDVQIDMVASGTIKAFGSFAVSSCGYSADLADNDCVVGVNDLHVIADQWLDSSVLLPCPLAADLSGNDCVVNLSDFAVMASQWMSAE